MNESWAARCRRARVSKDVILTLTVTPSLTVGLLQMEHHRIQQRSVLFAVRRMNEHPRRLVYDDQVRVFISDVERNVLREHRVFTRKVDCDFDEVLRQQPLAAILVT